MGWLMRLRNVSLMLLPCAANERTFLHWLSTSVTLGTISSALAGECPIMPGRAHAAQTMKHHLPNTFIAGAYYADALLVHVGVVGHSKLAVSGPTNHMLAVQCVATAMVLVSIIMAIMATANFYIRGRYLV